MPPGFSKSVPRLRSLGTASNVVSSFLRELHCGSMAVGSPSRMPLLPLPVKSVRTLSRLQRCVLAGLSCFVIFKIGQVTSFSQHAFSPKYAAVEDDRFLSDDEISAIKLLLATSTNAECKINPLDLSISPTCPPVPVCKSRGDLLQSFARGRRRAGFNQPFCFATCRPRWLSRREICGIMGQYESVSLIGDSLVRQLGQAILLLVRGDIRLGSINRGESTDIEGKCACDKAYVFLKLLRVCP